MTAFAYLETSIPPGITIAEYRRARATEPRSRRKRRLRLKLRRVARESSAGTA